MPLIPSIAPGLIGRPKGATNLVSNGGFETNTTGWAAFGAATLVGRNTTNKKFGAASCEVLCASSAQQGIRLTGITVAASTQYTYSAWILAAENINCVLTLTDNIDQGLASGNLAVPANAWTRISYTATTDSHTTRDLRVEAKDSVGAHTFYVDGVQLELGAVATPYIETDGATASRSALKWVA